jgi:hypothetical protein
MKSHQIKHTDAVEFILAGKSLFTLLNSKSDNRFTFKVKKHKVDDVYFVSVLTNPDVYQFLGIIKNQKFTHSKSSKISKDAQSFRVFDYVFFNLCKDTLPEFIEIWHEGKCGKCGRTLTVPLSIETGFGPECQKRLNR